MWRYNARDCFGFSFDKQNRTPRNDKYAKKPEQDNACVGSDDGKRVLEGRFLQGGLFC